MKFRIFFNLWLIESADVKPIHRYGGPTVIFEDSQPWPDLLYIKLYSIPSEMIWQEQSRKAGQ
jgi:hypothetical protein